MAILKTQRRWLRFSLRTMLVLVLVLNAYLAWQANRAARQRRAVEALRAAGAEVFYDYHLQGRDVMDPDEEAAPPGWAWIRDLVGVDFYAEVEFVHIENFDDEADIENFDEDADPDTVLNELENVPTLRTLTLMISRIDRQMVAAISRLHGLEELVIWFSEIDDVDLGALAELHRLRILIIWYGFDNKIMPGRVAWVGKLRDLEELWLYGPITRDDDLAQMRDLSNLRILNLSPAEISNEGLAHLNRFPALEDLYIDSHGVSDKGVKQLRKFRNLRSLHLTDTQISQEGFRRLQSALPKTVITH